MTETVQRVVTYHAFMKDYSDAPWYVLKNIIYDMFRPFMAIKETRLELLFENDIPCEKNNRYRIEIVMEKEKVTLLVTCNYFVGKVTLRNFSSFPKDKDTGLVIYTLFREKKGFNSFSICVTRPA
jgi:hypothetical protein